MQPQTARSLHLLSVQAVLAVMTLAALPAGHARPDVCEAHAEPAGCAGPAAAAEPAGHAEPAGEHLPCQAAASCPNMTSPAAAQRQLAQAEDLHQG